MTNSKLKATIGKRLYDRLTPAQRMLMVKTAGTIKFSSPIDIKKVYRYIEGAKR